MMKDNQLLTTYIEALRHNPHAIPPVGLTEDLVDFAQTLVASQQASPLSQQSKSRIWQDALQGALDTQPQSEDEGVTTTMTTMQKTRQTPFTMSRRLALTASIILIGMITLAIYTTQIDSSEPDTQADRIYSAMQATETTVPDATATPDINTADRDGTFLDMSLIEPEYQTWNNGGAVVMAMALQHYRVDLNDDISIYEPDPSVTQNQVRLMISPNVRDVFAEPHEFVNIFDNRILPTVDGTQSVSLRVEYRFGGNIEVLQNLIDGQFPVMVATGYDTDSQRGFIENQGWFGQYQFLMGYDSTAETITVWDPFLGEITASYEEFDAQWRTFNRSFIVVSQESRYIGLGNALGVFEDQDTALDGLRETYLAEAVGDEQDFWSWYNLGEIYFYQQNYTNAAGAFEIAFSMDAIPERVLWYRPAALETFYQLGEYQTVYDLMDTQVNYGQVEYFWYYNGLIKIATGDISGVNNDLLMAVQISPNRPDFTEAYRLATSYFGTTPEIDTDFQLGQTFELWNCEARIDFGTMPTNEPVSREAQLFQVFSDNHTGVDWQGNTGDNISAAGNGTVVSAGWNEFGYGNHVVIAHYTNEGLYFSLYAQLETTQVRCGQRIDAGQTVGTMGSTGRSSEVHLHFEIRDENFDPVPPLDFLLLNESDASAQNGELAPDFTLETVDGQSISLSDYQGQPVLVMFWYSNCGPCRIQMEQMQMISETNENIAILAVNMMELEVNATDAYTFIEELDLSIPIVYDTQSLVRELYNINTFPSSLLVDEDGILTDIHTGPISATQLIEWIESLEVN